MLKKKKKLYLEKKNLKKFKRKFFKLLDHNKNCRQFLKRWRSASHLFGIECPIYKYFTNTWKFRFPLFEYFYTKYPFIQKKHRIYWRKKCNYTFLMHLYFYKQYKKRNRKIDIIISFTHFDIFIFSHIYMNVSKYKKRAFKDENNFLRSCTSDWCDI